MFRRLINCCLCLCVCFLAGCGSGGSSGQDIVAPPVVPVGPSMIDVQALLSDDEAAQMRIMGDPDTGLVGIPGSVWSIVPLTGQAIFRGSGVGNIAATQTEDDITLRGDVFMTVKFGEDDITGGMRNIVAHDSTTAYNVDGAIILSNGDVAATQPNNFTVDYAGDLTFADNTYVVDGSMDGLLRGVRFGVVQRSPIRALSAIDNDGSVTIGDDVRDFSYTIVAETR